MPLANCSFGMIPLSRHSVDHSPRVFHSSTHNVVRASCFEVISASVQPLAALDNDDNAIVKHQILSQESAIYYTPLRQCLLDDTL